MRKQEPLYIRTYKNWRKYRKFINQYKGTRDDLVQKLLEHTASMGFNRGVEVFEIQNRIELDRKRDNKEYELRRHSEMSSTTLEDMLEQKRKMEEEAEAAKHYRYDPNWLPTFREITSSNYLVVYEKVISSNMYFKVYHAKDKMVYVGVSVVPGTVPAVMVRQDIWAITDTLGKMFEMFSPKLGEEKEEKPVKVNIDHVNKAMGNTGNQDKKLNDLLDDIF